MPQSLEDYYKMTSQMYAPYLEGLKQMYAGWAGMSQEESTYPHHGRHPHHHHHHHDCGCDECRSRCDDSCNCQCCIGDADLVVYARVGERRVVPVTIDNSTRRERAIKLELSNFSRGSGRATDVNVQSSLSPQEFTLRGCDEQTVAIVVETGFVQTGGDVAGAEGERTPLDVDDCLVLYADLRVEGCDIRSVRIALVLMPRDCDAYEVDCGCSCC